MNTFQCVLATDGALSFVIFLYPSGGLQWARGENQEYPSIVGFNAGDNVRFTVVEGSRDDSTILTLDAHGNACADGVYIYQVNSDAMISGQCSTVMQHVHQVWRRNAIFEPGENSYCIGNNITLSPNATRKEVVLCFYLL